MTQSQEDLVEHLIEQGYDRETAEEAVRIATGPMFGDIAGGWK
jgi:predicted Ser/Thr protein kinase